METLEKNKDGVAIIKEQFLFHEPKVDSSEADLEPVVKKARYEEKKRGQNKNRFKANKSHMRGKQKLCPSFIGVVEGEEPNCSFPNCKHLHDVAEYLQSKPPDLGPDCFVFQQNGFCKFGITCRFSSKHTTSDGKNTVDISHLEAVKKKREEWALQKELIKELRKKQYNFETANKAVEIVVNQMQSKGDEGGGGNGFEGDCPIGPACDDVKLKDRERKQINWKDKLYLSPLTTLGNLPFRRICKEWGADITCGEMAMAAPLLQGEASEWALLRKHSSEDLFGVQVCGNNPHLLSRCTQLIQEKADVDFIDLNLGCPIELVFQKGAGSGLLRRERNLEAVIRSICLTSELPVTVKTRTGIYNDKPVALKLIPIFKAAGVSLITVHGRSKEQRYTRNADWGYIERCAQIASPTPLFGNGDILSYHDYKKVRDEAPCVSGVMIGRGALYKPWIFTEIKEQRDWDISSKERLEILRKFVNYGFENWGTDNIGVENTRRFLLEWLSFLYRYIPVGLLETVPQKMNERPPRYVGRDDLETLMASPNCADWIKISEMLCGPVPENFIFLPKHKANSWG